MKRRVVESCCLLVLSLAGCDDGTPGTGGAGSTGTGTGNSAGSAVMTTGASSGTSVGSGCTPHVQPADSKCALPCSITDEGDVNFCTIPCDLGCPAPTQCFPVVLDKSFCEVPCSAGCPMGMSCGEGGYCVPFLI